MAYPGIHNDHDFYSEHYLNDLLENDLKEVQRKWTEREEEGLSSPVKLLANLARRSGEPEGYFAIRAELDRLKEPAERMPVARRFLLRLLEALGYAWEPDWLSLDDGGTLPIVGRISHPNGAPWLYLMEALPARDDETADPLTMEFRPPQFDDPEDYTPFAGQTLDQIITRRLFTESEPPRWVLLLSIGQVVLIDRGKWNAKRLLRFDLEEILSRRDNATLRAMAALLHRESLCPDEGSPLHDSLDENSHRHAFSVSESLKYALREAIELLGNEAIWYLREVRHEALYTGANRLDERQLTEECLRFMYRLLFLFYIEARPELGYAPMNAEVYRQGYSLEMLRDLELARLETEEARNGSFIHQSIAKLFRLIFDGFRVEAQQLHLGDEEETLEHHTFRIAPLRSHLFDPDRTPTLNRVRLRNHVMQRVIELMSLSDPDTGSRYNRRGRISYAQLGINQLGAVYEALLSYSGFFATKDLYEVKKAGETYDPLEHAYFVGAEDLEKYTDDEKVYDSDGNLRLHPKGSFIYRLSGRDREKSASYYTPEVLTKCVVKYALKELVTEEMTADQIVELTVCEPAMGSGAFLNEAVSQLAALYLERKQREMETTIPHDEYLRELQRVKMFIADNNVYGVDLNPVAVELAEVSIWLNTIHAGAFVPYFGMQLVAGNSLVGGRRQVFATRNLRKTKKNEPLWLELAPERVMPGEERPDDTVYHFLLPDNGMAAYNDRVVKEMAPDELKTMGAWRKEFTKPFSDGAIRKLERLSGTIDRLWRSHTAQQRDIRRRTNDPMEIFGRPLSQPTRLTTTREKDTILNGELRSYRLHNSSPYRRLQLAMDYWCALWFWPIEKADLLPDRDDYLFDLSLILDGGVLEAGDQDEPTELFPKTQPKEVVEELRREFGVVDVDALCEKFERLGLVRDIARRQRFLHWELEFADLFDHRGGFDLVLGNPPWIKVEWNEGGLLGDYEPLYDIRNTSASDIAKLRDTAIERFSIRETYLQEFAAAEGMQSFLNGMQNFPSLRGIQSNLYKCFLPQTWMVGNSAGVVGLLHPDGIYDDPKGGTLRRDVYSRLRTHFQFVNEYVLFEGVHHNVVFSINVFCARPRDTMSFANIANLYVPGAIDASFDHTGNDPVPGIKDDDNRWNRSGHRQRIVWIDEELLALFAVLYDAEGTEALEARLPAVHSAQVVDVLRKFAVQKRRLSDLAGEYVSTEMWHETNSQKDGTIRRETRFVDNPSELILSGPHFFVGLPLYKTPRAECRLNSDYDVLDLTTLPDDYLPRTNYVPACTPEEYRQRTPTVPWEKGRLVTEYPRLVHRRMLSQSGERTIVPAIVPNGVGHINTVLGTAFVSAQSLLSAAFTMTSLVYDFFVKTTGRGDFFAGAMGTVPLFGFGTRFEQPAAIRVLRLTCLTTHYVRLWMDAWTKEFSNDTWAKTDPRLDNARFSALGPTWTRACALRTDYERRQALVELDVLAAMALGLTLDELQTIYRIQFPVLQQNEADTWYDRAGRIVFTCSRGLTGVGYGRKEWEEIKEAKEGTFTRTVMDDTLPGGPRERVIEYTAPFDRCDREEDYRVVWGEFERRFSGDGGD